MMASRKIFRTALRRLIPVALLAEAGFPIPASGQGWQHMGAVQHVEKLQDGVEVSAGNAKVRVTVFREGVIRVRVATQGNFPKDSSWAVIESEEPPSVKIDEDAN